MDFVQVCRLSLISITILCVSFTNSATVGRLEQVQLCNRLIDQSADNITGLKCAKECLILKYKYIQNPWLYFTERILRWAHFLRSSIIITFIIKMYVNKMTCIIQYPCSKHAYSPSLPQKSNVGIHMPLIHYQCTFFDNIDFGERGTEFLLQNVPTVSYKIILFWIHS